VCAMVCEVCVVCVVCVCGVCGGVVCVLVCVCVRGSASLRAVASRCRRGAWRDSRGATGSRQFGSRERVPVFSAAPTAGIAAIVMAKRWLPTDEAHPPASGCVSGQPAVAAPATATMTAAAAHRSPNVGLSGIL